jgi:hypothetical protein
VETFVAALLSRLHHWAALFIGAHWFAAAQPLAEHDTAAASQAFQTILFSFAKKMPSNLTP